jgi:propionate CoA-transferase
MNSETARLRSKVITAQQAAQLIRDGDVVSTSGIGAAGFPEETVASLEERFLASGKPCNLTWFYASGQGDTKNRGLGHIAHEGLLDTVIGGHFGVSPRLGRMVIDGKVNAYNLPQGTICHLLRDIAAHKPGHLSSVGLGTFIDPRLGGGKLNSRTTKDIVSLVTLDGQDYIFYKSLPIRVGILRGTTADCDGNVTCEHEAVQLEQLALAMAAHNSGGIVIAEVKYLANSGTLDPRDVRIPAALVDYIVVAKPENHWQTHAEAFNPTYCGELQTPLAEIATMEMSERKIIARRAAMELRPGDIVNLGFGIPQGVGTVAAEEGLIELLTLTTEPGVFGGAPADGLAFGASANPRAIIDQPAQFDFYDGGGLDVAILGLAQADCEGNLNVSRFGSQLAGCGGFINICQGAKKLVFAGTFTTGGLSISVEGETLAIVSEGRSRKFIKEVEQRTFSGSQATRQSQSVLYVTERCVFRLIEGGLELIEIAPGVDLENDIFSKMDFRPAISPRLKNMDRRIFCVQPMELDAEVGP